MGKLRIIGLVVGLLACCMVGFGQELLSPVGVPQTQGVPPPPAPPPATPLEPLTVPFYDDFARHIGAPNPTYWEPGSGATAGTRVAINPPTPGVLLLDATGPTGELYVASGMNAAPADELTSLPIKLEAKTPSLYLSLRVQPQGMGSMPEAGDSLCIDLYNATEDKWHNALRIAYRPKDLGIVMDAPLAETTRTAKHETPTQHFFAAIIPIPEEYHQENFRFRIRNRATVTPNPQLPGMAGNGSNWCVDQIYLDQDRAEDDTVALEDITMTKAPYAVELPYQAIPWQLAQGWWARYGTGKQLSLRFSYRNLDDVQYEISRYAEIRDLSKTLATFKGQVGFIPLPKMEEQEGSRTYQFDWGALFTQPLQVDIVGYIEPDKEEVRKPFRWNDTLITRLRFEDFYAYDTGEPDNGYGVIGAGAQTASVGQRFDPVAPATITAVRVWFNPILDPKTRKKLRISFWTIRPDGTPGVVLYDFPVEPPEKAGWVEYALPEPLGFDVPILAGWRQSTNDMLNVGIDLHTPTPTPIYYMPFGGWQASLFKGALLYRLVCTPGGSTPIPEDPLSPVCNGEMPTLRLFPNPCDGQFQIEGVDEPVTLQIYTASGQLVRSMPYQPGRGVTLSGVAPGLYFVSLISLDNTRVGHLRLIVQ